MSDDDDIAVSEIGTPHDACMSDERYCHLHERYCVGEADHGHEPDRTATHDAVPQHCHGGDMAPPRSDIRSFFKRD